MIVIKFVYDFNNKDLSSLIFLFVWVAFPFSTSLPCGSRQCQYCHHYSCAIIFLPAFFGTISIHFFVVYISALHHSHFQTLICATHLLLTSTLVTFQLELHPSLSLHFHYHQSLDSKCSWPKSYHCWDPFLYLIGI